MNIYNKKSLLLLLSLILLLLYVPLLDILSDALPSGEILLVDCGTDYIQVAWGVSSYTYDHLIDPNLEGTEMDLDRVNGLVTYRGLQPGTQYTIFITNGSVILLVSSFTGMCSAF